MFSLDVENTNRCYLLCAEVSFYNNTWLHLETIVLIQQHCLNLKIERRNFTGVSKWTHLEASYDRALPKEKIKVATSKLCWLRGFNEDRKHQESSANVISGGFPLYVLAVAGTKCLSNLKLNGNLAMASLDSVLSQVWKCADSECTPDLHTWMHPCGGLLSHGRTSSCPLGLSNT